MADRAISELTPVTGVNADDSFVLQQNNRAMRLTGQVLLNWLAVALDGHGGINNIAKTSTSVLVDTYTITFADETTATFTVTNGKSIESIEKTSTSGLVDTYTITYNDSDSDSFDVTNGNGITSIAKTGTSGLVDTYTITFDNGSVETFTVTNGEKGDKGDNTYTYIMYSTNSPTQDSDMHVTPDNWMGMYCGASSTAPTSYQDYQWFEIKGAKGDTGDSVSVLSTAVDYAVSDSGTVTPQTWQSTMPTVPQGFYLWTRTVVTFTDGTSQTSTTTYTSCRNGIDGSGSVNSVNNINPDPVTHNVTLPMDNVPTGNSGNFVKSGGVALINTRHENSMAYPYDPTSTYEVGDYCVYDNSIYQCTTAIEMGETWDATHWTSAVICKDLKKHNGDINNLENGLAVIVDGDSCSQAVPVGGFAYIRNNEHGLDDGLYKNTSNAAFPVSGGTADDTVFTSVSGGIGAEVSALNGNLTSLGTITTGTISGSVSVPTGTPTEIGSITLQKGIWVIVASCDWGYGANGYRQIAFGDAVNPSRQLATTIATAGASKETYQQVVRIIVVGASTETVKLYAYHNNGSSINAYPYIYAVRVGSNN